MGFPGCGKQTFYDKSYETLPPKATMTNVDPNGCDPGNFSEDFISQLNEKVEDYDVVFVPFDNGIMRLLHQNSIDYDLFYPEKTRRSEFLQNFVRQKRNVNDIRKIDHKWMDWQQLIELDKSEYCHKHCLKRDEFIGNYPMIIDYVESLNEKQ